MSRFVTYTLDAHDEGPFVMPEADFIAGGLPEDWNDYVWQEAESAEAALARHDEAVDLWRADVEAGRDEKEAY